MLQVVRNACLNGGSLRFVKGGPQKRLAQAHGIPGTVNRDVKAVKWLPLKEAIETLSRPHEKVFLANVGPVVIKAARQALRAKMAKPVVRSKSRRVVRRPQPAPVAPAMPVVQLAGDDAKSAGNPLIKTIGGWIGRLMPQPSVRRLG